MDLQPPSSPLSTSDLPPLQHLCASRIWGYAGDVVADPSHPRHKLFETLEETVFPEEQNLTL